MRIGYLFVWNAPTSTGVIHKVGEQVAAWCAKGAQVHVAIVSKVPEARLWAGQYDGLSERATASLHGYGSAARREAAVSSALEAISASRSDIVYGRHDYFSPALHRHAKTTPVVLEVNSDDAVEACANLSGRHGLGLIPRGGIHLLTRRFALAVAAGFVFVTHELSKNPRFPLVDQPMCVIGNGIELGAIPVSEERRSRANRSHPPRLVFLGTAGQMWHGLDKVLALAARAPDLQFDLIGVADSLRGPRAENVRFHGPMSRAEYEPIVLDADIGLGTLALHRKAMSEASPLKVRLYLAYGLPTIIGYRDTDFIDGAPFLLELPNSEANVERGLRQIQEFVHEWAGSRVPRAAIQHLDVSTKEEKRLAFLSDVAYGWSR